MRRHTREITSFDEIAEVFGRADTIRLGINRAGGAPYVVPVSFGHIVEDGRLAVYVHGAAEGLKHDLIAEDSRVCVEADIYHGTRETEHGVTTLYESAIGEGRAAIVDGDEKRRGLDALLRHYGRENEAYTDADMAMTRVYKIVLGSLTGKRNL